MQNEGRQNRKGNAKYMGGGYSCMQHAKIRISWEKDPVQGRLGRSRNHRIGQMGKN